MSISDIIRVVMAALHDVSKHDDQRLDPKANASDTRAQRDATNTTSIHPVTDATTTKGFLKTGSGQILGNDGSNNVGLFGFDSTGTMVVKVAKSGFDADTASAANLIFNSSQNVFKIYLTGTSSITTPNPWASGNTQTVTIAHGLGYAPLVNGYCTVPNYGSGAPQEGALTNMPTGLTGSSGASGAPWFYYTQVRSDATNIYIDLTNLSSAASVNVQTWRYRYYILQETSATT